MSAFAGRGSRQSLSETKGRGVHIVPLRPSLFIEERTEFMTTRKSSERSEVKGIMESFEFLMQFTAEEQALLMSWLEELVREGQIDIDQTHPLASAFDSLARYVGHDADDLPTRAAVRRREADAQRLNQK